jgi:3-oxoacyl-[acyl-carrier protein] reductase
VSDDRSLDGRVAVVTGVSRRIGIGYAIARRLAADGAAVVAHHWTHHDAEQPWGADPLGGAGVIAALRAEVPNAKIVDVEADFIHPAAPAQVMDAARQAFGHVDVLVANHARSSEQDLAHVTAAEIDLSMAVNVRATLLLAQRFAEQHDDEREGGRIVWFTSGQHRGPMPSELPYIASKAALHELTTSVAADLAGRRITVNCVDPGATDTGYADDETRQAIADRHPQGRWSEPDDAARLVAWLCRDEARWITGQTIVSDGGAWWSGS